MTGTQLPAAPPDAEPTPSTTALRQRRRRSIRRGARHTARARTNVDTAAPLVDHLSELRSRLVSIALVFAVAFGVCYWQLEALFGLLAAPLDDRWPIQTLGVTEPFFTSLSIAAQAAFVIVTPLVAWHAWRFVRPAISADARRTIATLLFVAPALFVSGVVFCYELVLTTAVRVLLNMGPDQLYVVVRAADYYSFVTMMLLAMGAAFCFPLALLGLARIGLLSSTWLRSNRKIALVGIVVLAALLPTTDPISLLIEVLPLLALYELSIIAVRVLERRLARSASREHHADEAASQHD